MFGLPRLFELEVATVGRRLASRSAASALGLAAQISSARARRGVDAARECSSCVLRARDLRLFGADLVVGRKARVLRLLGRLLRAVAPRARTSLELGLARVELGARSSATLNSLDLALGRRSSRRPTISRNWCDASWRMQLLELVAVRDVALGLRGLALERAEVALDLRDDVADAQQVLLA